MKKNKSLFVIAILLVITLGVCVTIGFIKYNKNKLPKNVEVIDIDCESEDCNETIEDNTNSNIDENDNINNNNNNENNSTNSDTSTGQSPVNGNGNGTVIDGSGTGNGTGNGNGQSTNSSSTTNNNVSNNDNQIPQQDKIKLEVEDSEKKWSQITEIKIFNVDSIAPKDSGTYNFFVNNNTEENVKYNIEFTEDNLANVNMMYKLKRNNEYISGDDTEWVKYNELNIDNKVLNSNDKDLYTIDWKWVDSESDTSAGRTFGAQYRINIIVKAAETPEFNNGGGYNPYTGDPLIHYIELAILSLIGLIILVIKKEQKEQNEVN